MNGYGTIKLPDYRSVRLYSLYAIYTEERDLEKREGTRHLIELFQKHNISRALDLTRPNVALLEKPKKK